MIRRYKVSNTTILYIVNNNDDQTGGMLSIYNMYNEIRQLYPESNVELTDFGKYQFFFKPLWFNNNFRIKWLKRYFPIWSCSQKLIINVPEMLIPKFLNYIRKNKLEKYTKKSVLNILNQNSRVMPNSCYFENIKDLFSKVTMTLAFKCNDELVYDYLDLPPFYISSWFFGNDIIEVPYENKENICIISPDESPIKKDIIRKLERAGIKCIQFKKISFQKFRLLQIKAKWTISFGEGYDGYSAFQFLYDGFGFGVYDERFFPKDISLNNLPPYFFKTYEDMSESIVSIMKNLDSKDKFKEFIPNQKKRVLSLNSPAIVRKSLMNYYNTILNT